jgi:hypothetical protein
MVRELASTRLLGVALGTCSLLTLLILSRPAP